MDKDKNESQLDQLKTKDIDALASNDKSLYEMGLLEEVANEDGFQDSAVKEQYLLMKQNLESVSRQNSHRRTETWKDHFDIAFRCLFWLSALLFGVMFSVLVIHWIIPESSQWLSPTQISKLEAVVIAVIVSKAVTTQQNKLD